MAADARPEWWTEADDAEEALLLMELIDVYQRHTFSGCCTPTYGCADLRTAEDLFYDWRERRQLESRAAFLRIRQAAREEASAA